MSAPWFLIGMLIGWPIGLLIAIAVDDFVQKRKKEN